MTGFRIPLQLRSNAPTASAEITPAVPCAPAPEQTTPSGARAKVASVLRFVKTQAVRTVSDLKNYALHDLDNATQHPRAALIIGLSLVAIGATAALVGDPVLCKLGGAISAAYGAALAAAAVRGLVQKRNGDSKSEAHPNVGKMARALQFVKTQARLTVSDFKGFLKSGTENAKQHPRAALIVGAAMLSSSIFGVCAKPLGVFSVVVGLGGICLGASSIRDALGGRTKTDPPTDSARSAPLLEPGR